MDIPTWTTYFNKDERNSQGNYSEDDYRYYTQRVPDSRRRKQGMVFPEDAFNRHSLNLEQYKSTAFNNPSDFYQSTEPVIGPCHHTSERFHDIQRNPSLCANHGRALPPIPVEMNGIIRSSHKLPLEHKLTSDYNNRESNIPLEYRESVKKELKRKKRKGHNKNFNRNSGKKSSPHEHSETSVVLTVSIRNAKEAKKMKHSGINNNSPLDAYLPSVTVHPPVQQALSGKSDELKVPLRSKMRQSKRRCLIPMAVFVVFIIIGLLSAIAFIMLRSEETNESSSSKLKNDIGMIMARTHMRVLNRHYEERMSNTSSPEFNTFSRKFEETVNYVFLQSNYSMHFYGSTVTALRYGSIYTDSNVIFEDIEYLRNPNIFVKTLQNSSPLISYNDIKAVNIGEYVVDYKSIHVELTYYRTDKLPDRPLLRRLELPPKEGIQVTELSKTTGVPQEKVVQSPTTKTAPEMSALPIASTLSSTAKETRVDTTTQGTTVTRTTGYTSHVTTDQPTQTEALTSGTLQSTRSTSPVTTKTQSTQGDINISLQIDDVKPTTESTTQKQTTVQVKKPYIKVSSTNVNLEEKDTSVSCHVGNIDNWENLSIVHVSTQGKRSTVIHITSKRVPKFPSIQYADRLYLNLSLASDSANVELNFTLTCEDEGKYICKVYKGDTIYEGEGELKIKGLPSVPVINLPVEIVEGRPINDPITCSGNVGYPAGRLQMVIKPRGLDRFIRLPGVKETRSGKCGSFVTQKFSVFTPTLGGNGTLLKCQFDPPDLSESQKLFETAIMKVVPDDICSSVPFNTKIKHPYTCDKYVVCSGPEDFQVKQCPEKLCFDPKTKRCGQTGLTMSSTVAYMNEGVTSLFCRLLHVGSWTSISIYKISKNGYKSRILTVNNKTNTPVIEEAMKDRFHAAMQSSRYQVDVTLWIYSLICDDEGVYTCSADVPFPVPEATGTLNLKQKPGVPKIYIPTQIIDERPPREYFICEGFIGYPHGNLFWEIKLKGESEFSDIIPFKVKEESKTGNCTTYIKKKFSFTPTMMHDGMELRCVVDNPNAMPDGKRIYVSRQIHVIPANFCKNIEQDTKPHPKSCKQYIQCNAGYTYVQRCSIGLCFNAFTKQCDIPEPTKDEIFDPKFPCKPNKNGLYFPHKVLCNKYIWCVQGQEMIQNCPLGTLYLGEGQCTFNQKESHCYKKSTTIAA